MARQAVDLIGQKFGRLTVIERKGSNLKREAEWNCKCDCGRSVIVVGTKLKDGRVKSCGCLFAHNLTYQGETKPLTEWAKIKGIKNVTLYSRIFVYGWTIEEALETVINDSYFTYKEETKSLKEWARVKNIKYSTLHNRIYTQGLTIEEALETVINNSNLTLTYQGETRSLTEWAKIKGIKYSTLYARIYNHGWTIEKALEK